MASRRQLDFFGKLNLNETQRYGSRGKVAYENLFAAKKIINKVKGFLDSKKKPYAGDPNQLNIFDAIGKAKKKLSVAAKTSAKKASVDAVSERNKLKTAKIKAAKKEKEKLKQEALKAKRKQIAKERSAKIKADKEARALKKKLNNPYHTDGRASVLPANSKKIIQERLNKAKVPNASKTYAPEFHVETGNFKTGKGYTKRTFYGAAKHSNRVQTATVKNIAKRAKHIKKLSVATVATASLGTIVAAGINNKRQASKIPKGYKMVFGRIVRVRE
jgi:hypothetical protein